MSTTRQTTSRFPLIFASLWLLSRAAVASDNTPDTADLPLTRDEKVANSQNVPATTPWVRGGPTAIPPKMSASSVSDSTVEMSSAEGFSPEALVEADSSTSHADNRTFTSQLVRREPPIVTSVALGSDGAVNWMRREVPPSSSSVSEKGNVTFTSQWMRREPFPTTTRFVLASNGGISPTQKAWMRKEPPLKSPSKTWPDQWMRRESPPLTNVSLISDGQLPMPPRGHWMRKEPAPASMTQADANRTFTGEWMRREIPPTTTSVFFTGDGSMEMYRPKWLRQDPPPPENMREGTNETFTKQWMRREPPPAASAMQMPKERWMRQEPPPLTRVALASDGTIELPTGSWMRREPPPADGLAMFGGLPMSGATANMTFTSQWMRREPPVMAALTSDGKVDLSRREWLRADPPPLETSPSSSTKRTWTNQWMRREEPSSKIAVVLASDGTVDVSTDKLMRSEPQHLPKLPVPSEETSESPAKKQMRRATPPMASATRMPEGTAAMTDDAEKAPESIAEKRLFRSSEVLTKTPEQQLGAQPSSETDASIISEAAAKKKKTLTRRESTRS